MEQVLRVAGYARISYDEDNERYESIINQSNIIKDYAKEHFGVDAVTIFEDDNYSGYKFNRPDFNKLKSAIENDEFDVILAKDLSRIGRHNARTLLFLEEMQELGKRVIAINDSIDTSQDNNDITLGVKTWYNELYVKDISKKIKSTITNKQKNATWLCSVPYGYIITDYKTQSYEIDKESAEVIKRIFNLYLNGWGYKKIVNLLNDEHIPTPRLRTKQLQEQNSKSYNGEVKTEWSIVSVSHILENDFYIGTLRTGKYTRKTINGDDQKLDKEMHNVFPDFHEPIIDKDVFYKAQEIRKTRGNGNYRGVKKYDNIYSGFTFCGDCNAPMFSISNGKRPDAYYCGSYHKNGKKACTSHHIHVAVLDKMVKRYVKRIKENSSDIIEILNKDLSSKKNTTTDKKDLYSILMKDYNSTKEEIKQLKKQKLRESLKTPNDLEQLDEIYEELETELANKLRGLQSQLDHFTQVKESAKRIKDISRDALQIFDEILNKEKLTKKDLELIIDKIIVFEDRVSIKLRGDINSIFNIETTGNDVIIENGSERTSN
ncbi:MAG: recombinase family protein [Lachnospiraceae bacterium]|nr:recombinase family protein [Lachnospiraceae bacterium]